MRKESDYYPRVVASPSDGKVTGKVAFNNASSYYCAGSDQRGD